MGGAPILVQFWCASAAEPEEWWDGQAIEGPVAQGRWWAILPDNEWWLMKDINIRWNVRTGAAMASSDSEMSNPPRAAFYGPAGAGLQSVLDGPPSGADGQGLATQAAELDRGLGRPTATAP